MTQLMQTGVWLILGYMISFQFELHVQSVALWIISCTW